MLAVAATLSGCGQPRAPTRICVDDQGKRIHDADCATSYTAGWTGGGGAAGRSRWYYLNSKQVSDEGAPALGGQASEGSYTPEIGVAYGEASEAGISRGGFGGFGEGGDGGEGGGRGGGE